MILKFLPRLCALTLVQAREDADFSDSACTPCEVTFGNVVVRPKTGCSQSHKHPLRSGAYDMPHPEAENICPSSSKCKFKAKRIKTNGVSDSIIKVSGGSHISQDRLDEWAKLCIQERNFSLHNHGEHKNDPKGVRGIWVSRWWQTHLPIHLYEQLADQICTAAGSWGPVRVTRLWCNVLQPHQSQLLHDHYNSQGAGTSKQHRSIQQALTAKAMGTEKKNQPPVNKDALGQGVGVFSIRSPVTGGELTLVKDAAKGESASGTAVKKVKTQPGNFIHFSTSHLHGTLPTGENHKFDGLDDEDLVETYRISLAFNFVTEDAFRAAYTTDWHFQNGWGPVGNKDHVQEQLAYSGDAADRFQDGGTTKVVQVNHKVKQRSLERPWPAAVLSVPESQRPHLTKEFEEAERIVSSALGPLRCRPGFPAGMCAGIDGPLRAKPFAWYVSPGESSHVHIHLEGKSWQLDCTSATCDAQSISSLVKQIFDVENGGVLPRAWNYSSSVFPPKAFIEAQLEAHRQAVQQQLNSLK